ncbi:Uncharacterized protein Adt_18400 [Abeliophyllum distichum]|uniref:Uncharacterized protein n=1 Tax=Abeliophyllum distichum TaxID=126358 RepID=A0ABD1TJA2_9LAMI
MKGYFKRFSNIINKIKNVTDNKALDALITGLHMRNLFWTDIQNREPKSYTQLVDLIQREIHSEKTIENREKAERDKGDRYHQEGRRSTEPRTNHYRRYNQTEVIPAPLFGPPIPIL